MNTLNIFTFDNSVIFASYLESEFNFNRKIVSGYLMGIRIFKADLAPRIFSYMEGKGFDYETYRGIFVDLSMWQGSLDSNL